MHPNPETLLPSLASALRADCKAYLSSARTTIEHAKRGGDKLNEAKEQLLHGEFGLWREAHFIGSERASTDWMKVSRFWPELEPRLCDIETVSAALAFLSDSKSAVTAVLPTHSQDEPPQTAQNGTFEDWRGADEYKTTPRETTPNTASTPPPVALPDDQDIRGGRQDLGRAGEDGQAPSSQPRLDAADHADSSTEAGGVGGMAGGMGRNTPVVVGTPRRRAKVKKGRFVKEREEIATLLEALYSKVNNNTSISVAISNRCISLLERIDSGLETADVRDCKPSIEMIIEYAESKGIDEGAYWAERFYYYEMSTDWQVGSKYMVDWRMSLHDYILKNRGWKKDADERYEKRVEQNGKPTSVHAQRAAYSVDHAIEEHEKAAAALSRLERDPGGTLRLLSADGA